MDASAYLTRYGWTGGGLGYKQAGIKKPILASRKDGFSGVGVTKASTQNDQWWLNAFDAELKALNKNEQSIPTLILSTSTMLSPSGLYKHFVRGEGLRSTIGLVQNYEARPTKKSQKSSVKGPPVSRPIVTIDRPQGRDIVNRRPNSKGRMRKEKKKIKLKGLI